MAALASLTITRACSREICGSSSTRSQLDFRPIVIEPALSSSVRNPSLSRTSRLRAGLLLDEPDPDECTALKATTPSSKGRIAGIFQQEWPGALSLSRTIPHYPEACP